MKKYCMSCGQPTEIVGVTPKFCSSCGKLLAATTSTIPAPTVSKVKVSLPNESNTNNEDGEDDEEVDYIPNINSLAFSFEKAKINGFKLNDLLNQKPSTETIRPPSTLNEKQTLEAFRKEASSDRKEKSSNIGGEE